MSERRRQLVMAVTASFLLINTLVAQQNVGGSGQANPAAATSEQAPYDLTNWLEIVAAVQGAGGLDQYRTHSPEAYAGAKLGLPFSLWRKYPPEKLSTFTLDVGYDRVQAKNGFATEISTMVPVFRFPGPQRDESKNYVRIYAEPGVGYRAGGGPFGGYASAKVMIALFSDRRLDFDKVSPYIEFQHRFPFSSPLQGDNRIAFGLMIALCNTCGLD